MLGGLRGKFSARSKWFFLQLTCLFLLIILVIVALFSGFAQPSHARSLQARSAQVGSPHQSPQNPWGMYGIEIGSGSCSWSMYGNNIYYPSPAAILTDALLAFGGGDAYSSGSTYIFNSPGYYYNIENAPCFPGGRFYITAIYGGTDFGQMCSDGSYEDGGQFCAGTAPSPKTLGSNGCTCSTGNSGNSSDTTIGKGGNPQAGDPIDIASGNVYEQETDYQSVGMNRLDFTRYYNSNAEIATTFAVSLGSHWRNTYDRYLNIISSSLATVERMDGKVLSFTNNGSGWVSDSDVDMVLSQSGTNTWTLTDTNDTVETYTQLGSGEGLLNSITLRDGYTQVLAYNSGNQLTSVKDSFGRTLKFAYTGTLLSTVTTPNGLVITYSYDSSGLTSGVNDRLAGVSYSTSPATNKSYYYTQRFDMYDMRNENGDNTFWTYDVNGRGLSSENDSTGVNLTTVAYNDATGNRTVTNALGQQEVYKFTLLQGVSKVTGIDRIASSTVPAATQTYTYDSNGYVSSITDWKGNVTQYVNNSHGMPTSITEASGTGIARTTTITYDSTFFHLPAQIVQPRLTTSFTYDASGNMLTRTETDTSGGSTNGQTRTWTSTYDSKGHVLTATGPRTDVLQTTTFTYSGNNIATITDPLGHVSKMTSYNKSGLPLSMTDPNGVITTFTYDIRDRLLTQTVNAVSGNAQTSFGYDGVGNLTLITLPDKTIQGYGYDYANRLNNFYTWLDNLSYTLDANGDVVKAQSSNGFVNGRKQSAVFDSLGRMLQQIGAAGQTTNFAYDSNGNALSVTNALGNATTQTFDPLNRQVKQIDPLGNATSYAFDAQDNLTSVTDPRNLTTTYTYDGFGEVLSETSPDKGMITYTLDKAGNRISETDARGIVTNRTFDALNRVLTETYPASVGENVTYTYDVKSKTNFGIGHLGKVKDTSGTTSYTYNERGDILTDSYKTGALTYTTSYTYDLADNVSSITYPSGNVISYTRDRAGRISSIGYQPFAGASASSLVRGITYIPFGPVSGLTYGNALSETLSYDQDYRLTAISTGNVQNLTLAYNAADTVTSITDTLDPTRNQTFSYDKDYRLLSATGKYGTVGYTYDADGNRLAMTTNGVTSAYTYSTTSNELTSVKTGSVIRKLTYLANGDLSKDTRGSTSTIATFSYNDRNYNSKVTINGISMSSKQNALGERIIKTVGTAITDYQYDLNGHVIAESNGSTGAVTREYVYLNDMPLAQIESDGTIYFIHNDQTGTPQKMTDASQNVVWDRIQQPFGETVSITGTVTDNIRFAGQYADSESGLNENWHRSYDSTLGRYTQGDPIGLAGGINLYGYVENNPVSGVDPQGLDVRVYGGGHMGIHEAIAVDTSSGIFTFGFGPKWSSYLPLAPGRIDEGNGRYADISGGHLVSTYPLSPSDGDTLVKNLRKLENNPPLYVLIGFNCNNFANTVASYASQGRLDANSLFPIDINRITK